MLNRSGTKIAALCVAIAFSGSVRADEVPVTFSGGHDTDPQDKGRPVVLIAAALGVKPDVFRQAFKRVTPAKDGRPSPEEAQRNKAALLKVLKPYKVTNERLDEVSNYYRYRPQNGELWKTREAKAHAVIENGKITRIVITEPGSGYSSPPKLKVIGQNVEFIVTLTFEKDLKKNGGIKSIEVKGRKAPSEEEP